MKIIETPIGKVKPYSKNPRINESAVDQVAQSIKAYGFQQPIVVDNTNNLPFHVKQHKSVKIAWLGYDVLVAGRLNGVGEC